MKGVLLHNSSLGINQYIIQTFSYYTVFFFSLHLKVQMSMTIKTEGTKGLDDMVLMHVPDHYYSVSTYTFMRHILYSNFNAK